MTNTKHSLLPLFPAGSVSKLAYALAFGVLVASTQTWPAGMAFGESDSIEDELLDEEERDSAMRWVCRDGAKLIRDGKVIDTLYRGDVVEHKAEKDGSTLVFSSGLHRKEHEGWISSDDLFNACEAIEYFNKAIESDPNDARAYLARAGIVKYGGIIATTTNIGIMHDLDRAIELNPKLAVAYVERGTVRYDSECELAEQDFTDAIRLEPNAWIIFYLRGECRLQMKKLSEAIEDFGQALKMKPNHARLHFMRGEVRLELGDFQNALNDLRQAEKLDESLGVGDQLYEVQIGLGRYQEVIETASKAIHNTPQDGRDYAWRAQALAAQGKFQVAADDFFAAVIRDPDNSMICRSYASFLATCPDAHFRNGANAYVLAKRVFRNDISISGDSYDFIGDLRENFNKRLQFDIKWIRKGWTNWQCLDTLAAVYAEEGKFEKAAECQEMAIRSAPQQRRKPLHLRMKLYKSGKPYRFKSRSRPRASSRTHLLRCKPADSV